MTTDNRSPQLERPNLVHKKENRYFALLVTASALMGLSLVLFVLASLGLGLLFLAIFVLVPLFAHWISIGMIRTNGVKVTERQFPEIHGKMLELSRAMGLRQHPDVYLIQSGGHLNAFATRFFRKNMVVLYSEVAELLEEGREDELYFILAHELAHLERSHVSKSLLLLLGNWVPFLSSAYSRACEYTCDRMAVYYTARPEAGARALAMLGAGKLLAPRVDLVDYLEQSDEEKGFIAYLSEKLSTHPTLPKRIAAIRAEDGHDVPAFKAGRRVKGVFASLIVVGVLLMGGLIAAGSFLDLEALDAKAQDLLFDDFGAEALPLQSAVESGTASEVEELLATEDVNATDEEGSNALHYLAYRDSEDTGLVAQMIIDAGIDTAAEDDYEMTPLQSAAYLANLDAVQAMLDAGIPVDQASKSNWTSLHHAVDGEATDAIELLLAAGADPTIENDEGVTPYELALEYGYSDIVKLLK
ncbi:M48 family metallopeptidase [Exiguobacterium flavidum]|uniref:M48 family metallopeptidase n=1 Tax=Exiguobacterium flavidum TaxID=2184695 RepID=UPI000DF832C0|nr:M48 family metallopeptidase [Exiguobacterium flavidum]